MAKDDPRLDVYVLAKQADPSLVDEIKGKKHKGLRYIALTTGSWQAFAVLEERDLSKLPDDLKRIFGNPGASGLSTSTWLGPIAPMQLKRSKPYKQITFVRIGVEPGRGEEVLRKTARITGYNGSSLTAGSQDLIVEFGAEDRKKLGDILVGELHTVPGIRWSESLFVAKHWHRDHPV